jgi:N6-adenosine-specific RNA methylase IME4
MTFPIGPYTVIYADPPWAYDDTCDAGQRGAAHKYHVMNDADITALPVGDITAKDSILFMWATYPKLREAFDVIDGWGFTYKTNAFTWVKYDHSLTKPFWGMGHWTRSNAEICLLAVKGKPTRVDAGVSSVMETLLPDTLRAPIAGHSEKPNEVRTRIVELVGDVPRIELFARKRYLGWDAWGNQVNDHYEDAVDSLF